MGIALYNDFAKKSVEQYIVNVKKKRKKWSKRRARRGIKCAKFLIRAYALAKRLADRIRRSRRFLCDFFLLFSLCEHLFDICETFRPSSE